MESFFLRYRNLLALLAILLAQIVGLAVQVRRTDAGRNTLDPQDGSGVRLIRLWANVLVSPPERVIHSSKLGAEYLWQNYLGLRGVREQNRDLQQTVDRLRLEQAALLEDARQGERLQSLLGFQERYIYRTVAAQVIGSSGSDQSRVFYLDKGSADGLDRDMAVITADGIVGKIRDVFPRSAQVLAINDQTSGAGVILETTRVRGILRGNVTGQTQIIGIVADQRIQPGERVLTAGGDQVFPRGLPVGVVEKVIRDPDRDSFIQVIVKPAAHLDRLDEVLVITSTEPRFSPEQEQDMAASEALKGPEAAAIQERKKASQIMAERLPGLTDPSLPPDQQPLLDNSNPNPVSPPPQPLRPDRFTPGTAPDTSASTAPRTAPEASSAPTPDAKPKDKQGKAAAAPASAASKPAPKTGSKPGLKPESKPSRQTKPQQGKPQQTKTKQTSPETKP
jgi:rod shape-determining protein MreC